MKRNKGFTLIELLAVIIILAIIALITVPVIMNIIERANKSAFKDSAYGIIKAGELHYADKLLTTEGMTNDITFTFPDATGLDIKGSRPKSGNMKVTKEGKIELAISNGKWCARKKLNEEDVTIDDNIDTCKLESNEKLLKDIATTSTELGVTEVNACATSGVCKNGDSFAIKVNDTETYKFYVIKDDGKEVTLIMNKNLGPTVAWITKEDYEAAGGTAWDELNGGANDKGPVTVLKQLEDLTKDWTNIKAYDYTLEDDRPSKMIELVGTSEIMYQPIKRTNVRARLPMLTDIENFIDWETLNVPTYLYENLVKPTVEGQHGAYWLTTARPDSSDESFIVHFEGIFNGAAYVSDSVHIGSRPVIKISKSL